MPEEKDDLITEPTNPEEPEKPSIPVQNSILNSVKKYLGYFPEYTEFDDEILMHINAGIFRLRQLGVGPKDGYEVTSQDQTYADYLGEGNKEISQVRLYLSQLTKLAWDPPSNSYVTDVLKQQVQEAEWRLNVQVDPEDTFE